MAGWQDRVGTLLSNSLPYCYKPVDSQFHGGAVRVDFIGMTPGGRFVAVEVKESKNQSYWTKKGVKLTQFQAQALETIWAWKGESYIAVGVGENVLFYPWESVRETQPTFPIPYNSATLSLPWPGPKAWGTWRIAFAPLRWMKESE